ncbi:MAG: endonuclease domain-containing protein [Myxococcaceae bacterium]|nr:endonuclease domain-containing protein [Myxococcaceae bacterium]
MALTVARAFREQPELHYPIVDWEGLLAEVDFAWPSAKVCVEFDGWKYHGTRQAFARDRARDRLLASRGWVVLRFTWQDVVDDQPGVIRDIEEVLDGRAPPNS